MSYFSKTGLTSTEANFLANVAKEMNQQIEEKLNGVKFYEVSASIIGSPVDQLMSHGITDISFIEDSLREVAQAKAFCAWIREAIKEKEAREQAISDTDIRTWTKEQGLEYPVSPECPMKPEPLTEKDIMDSWDMDKRNKYLTLEAFSATIGKYIHPNGVFSKARTNLHKVINNPITKEGTGRDLILYQSNPTVSPDVVDAKFLALQDLHRSYEKQLNQMKAELKARVNLENQKLLDDYECLINQYYEYNREFSNRLDELQNKFSKWKISEKEKIANLRITIPKELEDIFQKVKSVL